MAQTKMREFDVVEFFSRSQKDAKFQRLSELAGRLADLLERPALQLQPSLLACLDDLLGAVYSLMYATYHGYVDRIQPLGSNDVANVLVRARDMSNGRLRSDGKWTAGFYFNNALFRLAAVYHRSLKVVTNNGGTKLYVPELLPLANSKFNAKYGSDWNHANLSKIHEEVNSLKHTSGGIQSGRSALFEEAVEATVEIMALIEVML